MVARVRSPFLSVTSVPWHLLFGLFVRFSSAVLLRLSPVLVHEVLLLLYTPLGIVYQWRCRNTRARRLLDLTHRFSEGNSPDREMHFWRPIRARGVSGTSTGELVMKFGCDSGATLGAGISVQEHCTRAHRHAHKCTSSAVRSWSC